MSSQPNSAPLLRQPTWARPNREPEHPFAPSENQLTEEEQVQLAIALSLSEVRGPREESTDSVGWIATLSLPEESGYTDDQIAACMPRDGAEAKCSLSLETVSELLTDDEESCVVLHMPSRRLYKASWLETWFQTKDNYSNPIGGESVPIEDFVRLPLPKARILWSSVGTPSDLKPNNDVKVQPEDGARKNGVNLPPDRFVNQARVSQPPRHAANSALQPPAPGSAGVSSGAPQPLMVSGQRRHSEQQGQGLLYDIQNLGLDAAEAVCYVRLTDDQRPRMVYALQNLGLDADGAMSYARMTDNEGQRLVYALQNLGLDAHEAIIYAGMTDNRGQRLVYALQNHGLDLLGAVVYAGAHQN